MVFGRLDSRLTVNAILVSGSWLWSVQTCLDDISSRFQRFTTMKYLNKVLAFGLCDEGLQLGRGEGVDQASLGDDEQQNLSAGEDRKLVSLVRDGG